MSVLHTIYPIKLNPKRPPSHALIMRLLAVSLAAGHKAIDLEWRGETIELLWHDKANRWEGMGSINQESGHSIAGELNKIRDFVVSHFQYIGVGHV